MADGDPTTKETEALEREAALVAFYAWIRAIMVEKETDTFAQLARKAGMSDTNISRAYNAGAAYATQQDTHKYAKASEPTLRTIRRIAKITDIDPPLALLSPIVRISETFLAEHRSSPTEVTEKGESMSLIEEAALAELVDAPDDHALRFVLELNRRRQMRGARKLLTHQNP